MGFWDVVAGVATGGLSTVPKTLDFVADKIAGPKQAGMMSGDAYNDPNREKNLAMLAERQRQLQGQQTPLAGANPMGAENQAQMRARQLGLVDAMSARAAGTAPSVAEMQLQRGSDRGMANLAAQAASARGVNPAILSRQLMNNQAGLSQQTNADAAMLRAQEQAQAEQTLAGTLQGVRGADLGQAGQEQQLALANAAALQQSQAQQNALIAQYTQMGMSLDQAQFLAQMDREKQRLGLEQGDAARRQAAIGSIMSLGGQIGSMAATGGASAAGGGAAAAAPRMAGASYMNASNIA